MADGILQRYASELLSGTLEQRRTAVRVLVEMRDPETLDALVAALRDPEAEVRSEAARGIGGSRDTSAGDALDTVLKTDPDAGVRTAAAEGLGLMGDRASADALADALEHDPDERVRRAAAGALALMGGIPR